MIEVAGKHRKTARAVWVPVPRGVVDVEQRRRAAALTAAWGGWVWVMWGAWSRAYFAFGRWGWPPIVHQDARAVERAIGQAYARLREPGG